MHAPTWCFCSDLDFYLWAGLLGLVIIVAVWLLWPVSDAEAERRRLGEQILDDAVRQARAQAQFSPEAESSFRQRFMDRLRRLFWSSPK